MHWRIRRAWRRATRGPRDHGAGAELVETFLSGASVKAATYHHAPAGATGGPTAVRATEDAIRQHIAELRKRGQRPRRRKNLFEQLWYGLFPHLDPDRDDLAEMAQQLTAARAGGDTRPAAAILGYDDEGGYGDDLE